MSLEREGIKTREIVRALHREQGEVMGRRITGEIVAIRGEGLDQEKTPTIGVNHYPATTEIILESPATILPDPDVSVTEEETSEEYLLIGGGMAMVVVGKAHLNTEKDHPLHIEKSHHLDTDERRRKSVGGKREVHTEEAVMMRIGEMSIIDKGIRRRVTIGTIILLDIDLTLPPGIMRSREGR